jgi:type I restriction enzyme S subunit
LSSLQSDVRADQSPDPGGHRFRDWVEVELEDLMQPRKDVEDVLPTSVYRVAGVYSFGRGLIDRGLLEGSGTSYKTLSRLHADDVVISKLGAWEGAVAVVDVAFDGYYVSSEFPTFEFSSSAVMPAFFRGVTRSPYFWDSINFNTRGSMARRKRITPSQFLRTRLWLPPLDQQTRAADQLAQLERVQRPLEIVQSRAEVLPATLFNQVFTGPSQ